MAGSQWNRRVGPAVQVLMQALCEQQREGQDKEQSTKMNQNIEAEKLEINERLNNIETCF